MQEYGTNLARRRGRIALVLCLLLILTVVLWNARGALLPYVLAVVLVYLLLPVVNWLQGEFGRVVQRPRAARVCAIVVAYLMCFALIALFVSMIVPVLVQQLSSLWSMHNDMLTKAQDIGQQWLVWYRRNVPVEVQTQIDDNTRRATDAVAAALQIGVTRTFTFVTSTLGLVVSFIVIPVWMFYVLYDQAGITRAAAGLVPPRYRADAANLWRLVDMVLGAYVRGQLLLCVTIGFMASVGLTFLHVPFPLVLGVTAGLFEFLPFVGPILGAIPAVLVALVQSPILALWTIVLYFGIQQVENLVLAPRISGRAVQLHPALIIVVLVIGNELGGLWGMLVAVPVTAIVRDIFSYLYYRLQDEPCEPAEALLRVTTGVPNK